MRTWMSCMCCCLQKATSRRPAAFSNPGVMPFSKSRWDSVLPNVRRWSISPGQKGLKLGVDHNFLFLPSFERLRHHAADGTLGNLDQITVNWMYPLGLIQSGPFNNWILREPRNLFFELGPHLVAFVMDLVGPLESVQTSVSRPIDLPGRRPCVSPLACTRTERTDRNRFDPFGGARAGRAERLVRGHGALQSATSIGTSISRRADGVRAVVRQLRNRRQRRAATGRQCGPQSLRLGCRHFEKGPRIQSVRRQCRALP